MTDRLPYTERHYGMEMNVAKTKIMRISMQPSPVEIMADRKQRENVEYFRYLYSLITNDTRFTREIKSRIAKAKAAFNKTTTLFTSKLKRNLRGKTSKILHLEYRFKTIVLKLVHFGNWIRNT